jgi:hypothetical protein
MVPAFQCVIAFTPFKRVFILTAVNIIVCISALDGVFTIPSCDCENIGLIDRDWFLRGIRFVDVSIVIFLIVSRKVIDAVEIN